MKAQHKKHLAAALPALEELADGYEQQSFEKWASGADGPDLRSRLNGVRDFIQLARNAAAAE